VPDPAAAVSLLGRLRDAAGDNVTAFEIVGRPALELVLKHIPGARDPLPASRPGNCWSNCPARAPTSGDAGGGAGRRRSPAVGGCRGAASEAQTAALWACARTSPRRRRSRASAIKHDIAVPVSRIAEFIARADAALAARLSRRAHRLLRPHRRRQPALQPVAADAESNAEFIARTEAVNRIVHDLVHELGGSISAEHGLGQLKREEILRYKSETEMDLMRAVKQALDPRGLMNPGKVL
jgi:FAD/FMN-containing dehydrogenase